MSPEIWMTYADTQREKAITRTLIEIDGVIATPEAHANMRAVREERDAYERENRAPITPDADYDIDG